MVTGILPMKAVAATARRGDVTLVGPVDLTLAGRGVTAIIGPNGAGKTTLLRMMHGLERCRGGRIAWNASTDQVRRAQSFVFQHPVMLRRSVARNVEYPLRLNGVARAEIASRVARALDAVGLTHAAGRSAASLSGGERQKLALARAMVRDPEVLFLDEPCAALDSRATREVEAILIAARDRSTRLVLATHDLGQARRLADEVWFLLGGRLHEAGPAATFFRAPSTAAAAGFLRGDIVE